MSMALRSRPPPPVLDDAVRAAQRGDVESFETLYRAHVGRIYAFCLRSCGDVHRAENLTQDTFVRAYKHLGAFKGDSALSTWLFSIALNLIRDDYRKAKGDISLDDTAEPAAPRHREMNAAIDLERAIARLPQKARMVFLLHDVHGLTHQQIAAGLDITDGTSKAQLSRARALLRERLTA